MWDVFVCVCLCVYVSLYVSVCYLFLWKDTYSIQYQKTWCVYNYVHTYVVGIKYSNRTYSLYIFLAVLVTVKIVLLYCCYSHLQAIENIGNLQMGKWQQLMVPIKEMVDVLKVVREVSGIKRGSWVRIKRGMFKDDIARVSYVLLMCACIPHIHKHIHIRTLRVHTQSDTHRVTHTE